MIAPFLLALLAWPVIEIVVVVLVAGAIGWWPTLLALLLLSAAGEAVLRRASRRTTVRLGEAMRGGAVTADTEVTDGAVTMVGGVLMLIPGFVTGVIGLLLVLPVSHPVARRLIARRVGRHVHVIGRVARRGPSYDVIEGEVVDGRDDSPGQRKTGPRSLGG